MCLVVMGCICVCLCVCVQVGICLCMGKFCVCLHVLACISVYAPVWVHVCMLQQVAVSLLLRPYFQRCIYIYNFEFFGLNKLDWMTYNPLQICVAWTSWHTVWMFCGRPNL